jgi:hypothetical protein
MMAMINFKVLCENVPGRTSPHMGIVFVLKVLRCLNLTVSWSVTTCS